jgi:hypothetical protein
MIPFKEQWNQEMALAVLRHETVASKIWFEAAKWVLLYGPSELPEILQQASQMATDSGFPELEPGGYTKSGKP